MRKSSNRSMQSMQATFDEGFPPQGVPLNGSRNGAHPNGAHANGAYV